jgi:hemoglobin-like flavoprotein
LVSVSPPGCGCRPARGSGRCAARLRVRSPGNRPDGGGFAWAPKTDRNRSPDSGFGTKSTELGDLNMPDKEEIQKMVDQSYRRCRLAGTFVDDFYRELWGMSPEVAAYFRNTDMATQTRMLDGGVRYLILYFHDPSPITAATVHQLAEKHSRSQLGIPPQLHALWLEALVKTVGDLDPQFSPELAAAWRTVMEHGIFVFNTVYELECQ